MLAIYGISEDEIREEGEDFVFGYFAESDAVEITVSLLAEVFGEEFQVGLTGFFPPPLRIDKEDLLRVHRQDACRDGHVVMNKKSHEILLPNLSLSTCAHEFQPVFFDPAVYSGNGDAAEGRHLFDSQWWYFFFFALCRHHRNPLFTSVGICIGLVV